MITNSNDYFSTSDTIYYLIIYFIIFCHQYPDYIDAYVRLAAIAKARNNILLSIELVTTIPMTFLLFLFINYIDLLFDPPFYRLMMP